MYVMNYLQYAFKNHVIPKTLIRSVIFGFVLKACVSVLRENLHDVYHMNLMSQKGDVC